jgi:hypothetical protein
MLRQTATGTPMSMPKQRDRWQYSSGETEKVPLVPLAFIVGLNLASSPAEACLAALPIGQALASNAARSP